MMFLLGLSMLDSESNIGIVIALVGMAMAGISAKLLGYI